MLVASILDIGAAANTFFVGALGKWVWIQEKLRLVDAARGGWEHMIRDELAKPFYPLMRFSGPMLTVLLFAIVVLMFTPNQGNEEQPPESIVLTRGAGFAAFLMFGLLGASFGPDGRVLHILVWGAYGYASLCIAAGRPATRT